MKANQNTNDDRLGEVTLLSKKVQDLRLERECNRVRHPEIFRSEALKRDQVIEKQLDDLTRKLRSLLAMYGELDGVGVFVSIPSGDGEYFCAGSRRELCISTRSLASRHEPIEYEAHYTKDTTDSSGCHPKGSSKGMVSFNSGMDLINELLRVGALTLVKSCADPDMVRALEQIPSVLRKKYSGVVYGVVDEKKRDELENGFKESA